MKTLIELYDERPIENVLSTEVFRPERTVFICPPSVGADEALKERLRQYFSVRGVKVDLVFLETSLIDANSVVRMLESILGRYADCAIDIAGGTDAALFAAGRVCGERDTPVFTYSRKRNTFFNIQNAAFANHVQCGVQLSIEDCFLMAGGTVRQGRVDNSLLGGYLKDIGPFFEIFLAHRRGWTSLISWFQRASRSETGDDAPLRVDTFQELPGEYGGMIRVDLDALRAFEAMGFLIDLKIPSPDRVRFRFRNRQVRAWLRDVGSVLELAVYKACLDVGLYQEVRSSVVVDWAGTREENGVSNEIDVVAVSGVIPVFISCKTSEVRTEALNELAILRDRFGGAMARAAIVTSTHGGSAMRNRAAELGIDVIDLSDLQDESYRQRLGALLRAQ
ncbi:MAG: DUF1887 family protein [Clostridia bacterium]|nr:DUF1887 family protein [Clostridia bacterium]